MTLTPRAGLVAKRLSRNNWWTGMDEETFFRLFDNRESPYHLYDSQNRSLIRAETGKWFLAALLDDQDQLVFLNDPACRESSVLKKTFWAREWLSDPVLAKPCACGDGRCKGRLVITLHDSWTENGPHSRSGSNADARAVGTAYYLPIRSAQLS